MANIQGQKEAIKTAPKGPGKPEPVPVSAIPRWTDESGNVLQLKARDFPRTKAGRMAYCDYQVARWQWRKERIATSADPRQRKLRRIERLKTMLAKLELDVIEEEAARA